MSSYCGELVNRKDATEWNYRQAVQQRNMDADRTFRALVLPMGAYYRNTILLTERATCFARMQQIPFSNATRILIEADQILDLSMFLQVVQTNPEIIEMYNDDGGRSGVSESVPIILAFPGKTCFFCDEALGPLHNPHQLLSPSRKIASQGHGLKVYTSGGSHSCCEFVRICECLAKHFSSHAVLETCQEKEARASQ